MGLGVLVLAATVFGLTAPWVLPVVVPVMVLAGVITLGLMVWKRKDHPCKNIMVVDDDPVILAKMECLLNKKGIAPRLFQNPEDALRVLGREKFDVVFLDQSMPEMKGDEFVAQADHQCQEGYETCIVFLTSTPAQVKATQTPLMHHRVLSIHSKGLDEQSIDKVLSHELEGVQLMNL